MTWADIWVVSELEDSLWEDIFIKQFSTIQNAIDRALSIKGKDASVSLLSDGCITVPLLKNK
jgi:nickel-dependent lactate racemase